MAGAKAKSKLQKSIYLMCRVAFRENECTYCNSSRLQWHITGMKSEARCQSVECDMINTDSSRFTFFICSTCATVEGVERNNCQREVSAERCKMIIKL